MTGWAQRSAEMAEDAADALERMDAELAALHAVVDAARAVLAFRHDTPTTGYLRDNDASRDALRKLAAAVAAVCEA